MEWEFILLILILIVVITIQRQLDQIKVMISNMLSNSRITNLQNDLNVVKRQIDEIYKSSGIATKVKETKDKERSELRKRFIKQFLINNPDKSDDEAEVEMTKLFKEAEAYENSDGDDLKFWSIELWVKNSEEQNGNY